MVTERVRCCVPFCRRTKRRELGEGSDWEWICAIHWPGVPDREKRFRRLARKHMRRAVMAGDMERQGVVGEMLARSWARCKAAAIEAAAGI